MQVLYSINWYLDIGNICLLHPPSRTRNGVNWFRARYEVDPARSSTANTPTHAPTHPATYQAPRQSPPPSRPGSWKTTIAVCSLCSCLLLRNTIPTAVKVCLLCTGGSTSDSYICELHGRFLCLWECAP